MPATIVDKTITDIIDNEYKEYSMYVVECRAIPSYIDGFKSVSRKIIYSALNHFKGKKVKVSELGTSIASVANYHHGEISAMGAAVTLGAKWQNNVPLLETQGNFGSRLIQGAAAPRYIFANLSKDFYKYFTDFSVCNKHSDIENPEPQQYLPIIPWVLVNGIEGIAVGFACRYLPHDPKDIAKACIKAVKGNLKDNIDYIPVKLPDFNGEIIQDAHDRIITRGIVERVKRNTWLITEVPYGYDREKFFLHLDKMMEKNLIQDFEDQCNKNGFMFSVKMDGSQDEECSKDPISYFKLERPFTENYTALDEFGKLVVFDSKNAIIRRFVDFRLKKVQERIDFDIKEFEIQLNWYNIKMAFIRDVVNKNINLLDFSKKQLFDYCINRYNTTDEIGTRLIGTPVYNMTIDAIADLQSKIDETEAEIENLKSSDAKEVYLNMLKSI